MIEALSSHIFAIPTFHLFFSEIFKSLGEASHIDFAHKKRQLYIWGWGLVAVTFLRDTWENSIFLFKKFGLFGIILERHIVHGSASPSVFHKICIVYIVVLGQTWDFVHYFVFTLLLCSRSWLQKAVYLAKKKSINVFDVSKGVGGRGHKRNVKLTFFVGKNRYARLPLVFGRLTENNNGDGLCMYLYTLVYYDSLKYTILTILFNLYTCI